MKYKLFDIVQLRSGHVMVVTELKPSRPKNCYSGPDMKSGKIYRFGDELISFKLGVLEDNHPLRTGNIKEPVVDEHAVKAGQAYAKGRAARSTGEDKARWLTLAGLVPGDKMQIFGRKMETVTFKEINTGSPKYVFSAANKNGTVYKYPLNRVVRTVEVETAAPLSASLLKKIEAFKKANHYMVKYKTPMGFKFGIVEQYSEEAKAALNRGFATVSDAIDGNLHEVLFEDIVGIKGSYDYKPVPGHQDYMASSDEYSQHVVSQQIEHDKREASLPDDGQLYPGHQFRIGVGDGYASYVVTAVSGSRCMVEWRGFCLDRWTDHHFGYGGRFAVADVLRYVQIGKGVRRIFG